ncbi:MAG: SRPBCC family protein [Syntrophobacteraceae bacterium]
MESEEYKEFDGFEVERAITINKPAEELYRFWRNIENLPRLITHVRRVTVIDDKHSHWVAKGPAGTKVEWTSELTRDIPNRVLAWKSIDGDLRNMGSVDFTPAPGDRGTEVRIMLKYDPPGGRLGAILGKVFGKDPSREIADGLREFKQLMETGEIATINGQPSGRVG